MTPKIAQITRAIPLAPIGMILAKIGQVKNKLERETLLAMFLTGARHSETLKLATRATYSMNRLRYSAALQLATNATWSVNRHRTEGIVQGLRTSGK